METMKMSDKQGKEICDNVGRMLVDELDKENVHRRVEKTVSDYLKNNNIDEDASALKRKLEWSVKVRLKK